MPSERVREFVEEFPERSVLPLTREHGTALRRAFVEPEREEWESVDGSVSGTETRFKPETWAAAVGDLLESHEETRRTWVNLERGRPGRDEYEEFSVKAESRFMPEYQEKYFARLKGSFREFMGGERPSGGECEGEFEDPYVVLLTRSASAVPDGERLPPVDHANAIRGAWEPVYHTLRNTMRAMGFTLGEDWAYDRRWEPHKGERGGGVNHGYAHEHVVILVDGEVTPETFGKVLDKHVEECDPAGPDAHEPENAVKVKEADELGSPSEYVADYAAIEPKDLLERSPEYIGFAATVSAANIRTITRSEVMNAAAKADRCKQRYESGESEQSVGHGETVVKSARRGYEFECSECGSPHGVDQSPETLTEARIDPPVAVDGGVDPEWELRKRWESARSAAVRGEPPDETAYRSRVEEYLKANPEASVTEVLGALTLPPDAEEIVMEVREGVDEPPPVSFVRPRSWSVKSVTVAGEEYPADAGGGVDLVAVDLPERELRRRLDVSGGLVECECGVTVGADSVVSHLLTHGSDPDVLVGLIESCGDRGE